MMVEPREVRLKRLGMRSRRRGTREMDLILGAFAEAELARLDADALDAFEALLAESDPALYRWVSGSEAPPAVHHAMVARIGRLNGVARIR